MAKSDYEQFSEALWLDEDTGDLLWKKTLSPRGIAGSLAGSVDRRGYRMIRLAGKGYYAHRIVWLLTHKQWPTNEIDHINRDKSDNRPVNLRDTSRSQNQLNLEQANLNTVTGVRGVFQLVSGNYQVKIGRKTYGCFSNLEKAKAVRLRVLERALQNG